MAESSVPAIGSASKSEETQSQGGIFSGFLNLEFGRQLGLMLGLAASIAIGVGLALWLVIEKDYKPLYDNLDRIDAAAVIDVLENNNIDYRIDHRSGGLLVDSNKLHMARMQLASAGMPMDSNIGFELLDKEQPLGTSQFMENTRYRRGLEGELARTISSIATVRSARVHLAIPKSSVFVRDAKEPRASVFIEAYQSFGLDKKQVKAIANLVVSSVPELKLHNVTVVDQRGNLLSDFETEHQFAEAAKQLEYTRSVETDLLERVNSLLEPILGQGKYRAEVAVDLDFTSIEQTSEIFNPDASAIRSEQTNSEQTSPPVEEGGIPGAAANQPEADQADIVADAAVAEQTSPSKSRLSETRNFELDRTISYTRSQTGRLKRLTVAVAVDDMELNQSSEGEEATIQKTPWTEDDLERLRALVQDAVGYDPARGDRISVINTPFMSVQQEPLPELTTALWEQAWFWTVIRTVLGILAFAIVVFMILMPTMNRLTENSKIIKQLELKHKEALNAVNEVAGGGQVEVNPDGSLKVVASAAEKRLPPPNDHLDENMKIVKDMINEDPDRVAQVLQGWVASNE